MDVDWWARGIGIAALVLVVLQFGWRLTEWRVAGRGLLRVSGSAGLIKTGPAGPVLARGERFGKSELVIVDIVNVGRRSVFVTGAGFLDRASDRRLLRLTSGKPETLPQKLEPGQRTMQFAGADEFVAKASMPTNQMTRGWRRLLWLLLGRLGRHPLVAWCQDAEGRDYTGKVDKHFSRLIEQSRQPDPESKG